jgi:hypothetical protein
LARVRAAPLAFALLVLASGLGPSGLAHADSGDQSLAERLDQVRGDPKLSGDPAVIDDLATRANRAPGTSIRGDARMIVAEAWLGRLRRTDDALKMLRLVADDPAADALTGRLAEREIVDTLIAQGHIETAAREVRAHEDLVDWRFVIQVRRLERRLWLRTASLGVIVLFGLLVGRALLGARRRHDFKPAADALRRFAPGAVGFSAFVGVVGGTLASQFEAGNAEPFLLLGAAMAPLALLARAWSAVGSAAPTARIARALVCTASTFGIAFVLLEVCNPAYLDGFGL